MSDAYSFQKSWCGTGCGAVLLLALIATTALAAGPVANSDSAFHYGPAVVVDVLTNDTEADGEILSLTVDSVGTCIEGLSVVNELIRFAPTSAAPTTCFMTYRVIDESGDSDDADLNFIGVSGEIFSDDFESGNLNAWSFCVGC